MATCRKQPEYTTEPLDYGKQMYPKPFAHKHDLIDVLIPFEGRTWEPLQALQAMRDTFAQKPATAATIKSQHFYRKKPDMRKVGHHMPTLMALFGSWPTNISNGHKNNYANPEYIHGPYEPLTEPTERIQHMRRTAKLGFIKTKDLAKPFDCTKRHVKYLFRKYGVPWQEWRMDGKEKFGRTVKLYDVWGVANMSDVAAALGMRRSAIRNYHEKVNPATLPADPTASRGSND